MGEKKIVNDKSEDMENDLMEYAKILLEDMEEIQNPKGLTKENPGLSCKDIRRCNPDLPSGYYWIDPNEGSHYDAVRVHCNMTTGATCVDSTLKKVKKNSWSGEKEETIPYTADQTQLAFLQMLSKQASQRLTYHCRNSRATDRGLELVGVNEYEFQTTGEGMETLSHTVTRDECKSKDGEWRKTIFEITSDKIIKLPIVDFSTKKAATPSEEFGIEIGPVCFS